MSIPTDSPAPSAPKQRRSRHTQEQILAATERLLVREGDFTLLDLSRESGMSVGGIYRRFIDKDGLLLVMQERLNERMLQQYSAFVAQAGAQAAGMERQAAMMIAGIAETLKLHAPVLRKVVEASLRHPGMASFGVAAYHAHLSLFKQELLQYRNEIRHDDPEFAIEFCFNTAYELIASHFGFGRRGTVQEHDWERLVRNLQRLCVNYLACPA